MSRKACPFCGPQTQRMVTISLSGLRAPRKRHRPKMVTTNGDPRQWRVTCPLCGGCGPEADNTFDAIAAWNKRPSPGEAMAECLLELELD